MITGQRLRWQTKRSRCQSPSTAFHLKVSTANLSATELLPDYALFPTAAKRVQYRRYRAVAIRLVNGWTLKLLRTQPLHSIE